MTVYGWMGKKDCGDFIYIGGRCNRRSKATEVELRVERGGRRRRHHRCEWLGTWPHEKDMQAPRNVSRRAAYTAMQSKQSRPFFDSQFHAVKTTLCIHSVPSIPPSILPRAACPAGRGGGAAAAAAAAVAGFLVVRTEDYMHACIYLGIHSVNHPFSPSFVRPYFLDGYSR